VLISADVEILLIARSPLSFVDHYFLTSLRTVGDRNAGVGAPAEAI
jgi:hypothetical protein